jgi:hypothetical protein
MEQFGAGAGPRASRRSRSRRTSSSGLTWDGGYAVSEPSAPPLLPQGPDGTLEDLSFRLDHAAILAEA